MMQLEKLATFALLFSSPAGVQKIARSQRNANPAVVGYIHQYKLFLDMRSCLPADIDALTDILIETLANK